MRFMMIWKLLPLWIVVQFAVGSLSLHSAVRLRCPEMITAVPGDTVTLLCHLDPPTNLSAATVEVKRSEDLVHVYSSRGDNPGSQSDRYRTRTALNHIDLMRGVLKLQISPVNQSDNGSYVVLVLIVKAPKKLKVNCTIRLIVETADNEPKDQQKTRNESSTTSPPPEDGVTKSADPGVGDVKVVVIPTVVIVLLCLFLGVGLLKRRKIQTCLQRLRGQEQAERENVPEEIPLSDLSSGGLQLNGRAANGVRNTVQVI